MRPERLRCSGSVPKRMPLTVKSTHSPPDSVKRQFYLEIAQQIQSETEPMRLVQPARGIVWLFPENATVPIREGAGAGTSDLGRSVAAMPRDMQVKLRGRIRESSTTVS